jgi:hypothetical protein
VYVFVAICALLGLLQLDLEPHEFFGGAGAFEQFVGALAVDGFTLCIADVVQNLT